MRPYSVRRWPHTFHESIESTVTAAKTTARPSGIARSFIVSIILFSTALTVIATALQLYIDYNKDIRTLQQQLRYIETSHQQSLANDLWLFNDKGLQEQLKGILALPMVQTLRLEQTDAPALTLGQLTAGHSITQTIQLNYQHRDTIVPLGTLRITASTDQIIERLKERALLILCTQFVQIFFIAAFIYILFYYLIGRHLETMARHAAGISTDNLEESLCLQRTDGIVRHDELDLLVGSLNSMQHQIYDHLEERKEIEEQLRKEIEERSRIEDILHEQAALLEDEIAQRQQAQEELQLLNTTLEKRIEAAVVELRHKEDLLLQQNRLAAMGELLTSIAHQWRQPLNNIAAYIQNMQFLNKEGELTPDEMDRDIAAVMEILLSMSHTIDDFRGFFLKDRTQREFIVEEMVEKTLNMIKSTLDEHNIQVSITAAPDVRTQGYPNEYAQTLLNIIYNARDVFVEQQTRQPQIKISISENRGRSILALEDNGGGISPEILPQIFDPYFTTKGPGRGTGLGLYMAKIMIERNMGGSITARNHGEGAEFTIEL